MDGPAHQSNLPIENGIISELEKEDLNDEMIVEFDVAMGNINLEVTVGMQFESDVAARKFYTGYAKHYGFGIRCRKSRKLASGEIVSRLYVCTREGFHTKKEMLNIKKGSEGRSIKKCGCMARILVTKNKVGKWLIKKFESKHNHEMLTPRKASHRHLSTPAESLFQSLADARLPQKKVMDVYSQDVGGSSHDICVERDCKNFIDGVQRKAVEGGDANAVINFFSRKQAQNQSFYYAFQVDVEGRLTNVFWVDSRSRLNYYYFGDVVTFDTTYRTNKYDMPFAPFIGVNHHRQSILFGCALLLDESEASFVWLFEKWLEAMSGRHPVSIITNQDLAMGAAVAKVFPSTRHRLCWWNISKKFPEKLHLYQTDSKFKDDLEKCIQKTGTVDEFETYWKLLLEKYSLKENKWLQSLYDIRQKWVPMYLQDTFFANMKATPRSKVINALFDSYVTSRTSLYEFAKKYAKAVDSQFEVERENDFKTTQTSPALHSRMKLEKQAAEIYTHAMFKIFQHQFDDGLQHVAEEIFNNGDTITYKVSKSEEDSGTYIVTLKKSDHEVSCSCHFFEYAGILCSHILKIFVRVDIEKIPSHLVLKRWTKDAKSGLVYDEESIRMDDDGQQPMVMRYTHVVRRASLLAEDASINKDIFKVVMSDLDVTFEKIAKMKKYLMGDRIGKSASGSIQQQKTSESVASTKCGTLYDPIRIETKGKKHVGCLKSGLEKATKKPRNEKHGRCRVCEGFDHDYCNCPVRLGVSEPIAENLDVSIGGEKVPLTAGIPELSPVSLSER